jgi:hypothetical protein
MATALTLFDVPLMAFRSVAPTWPLAGLALVLAVIMLLVIRRLSDQGRLSITKNRIKGHLLELWLFRDDVRTVLRAQGSLLRLNGRYILLTLKPMLVLMLPIALVVAALEPWFGLRPLRPGETAVVSVQTTTGAALTGPVSLTAGDGVSVETPALRIPTANEIDWRIRVLRPGVHVVSVEVNGHRVDKQVVVDERLARVTPSRVTSPFWQLLVNPAEAGIPAPSAIERVDVQYPAGSVTVFGWQTHWLVYFLIVCLVFVFLLRRPLGVEI